MGEEVGEGRRGKEKEKTKRSDGRRERRKKGRRRSMLAVVGTKSLSQHPALTCLVSLPFLYDCSLVK